MASVRAALKINPENNVAKDLESEYTNTESHGTVDEFQEITSSMEMNQERIKIPSTNTYELFHLKNEVIINKMDTPAQQSHLRNNVERLMFNDNNTDVSWLNLKEFNSIQDMTDGFVSLGNEKVFKKNVIVLKDDETANPLKLLKENHMNIETTSLNTNENHVNYLTYLGSSNNNFVKFLNDALEQCSCLHFLENEERDRCAEYLSNTSSNLIDLVTDVLVHNENVYNEKVELISDEIGEDFNIVKNKLLFKSKKEYSKDNATYPQITNESFKDIRIDNHTTEKIGKSFSEMNSFKLQNVSSFKLHDNSSKNIFDDFFKQLTNGNNYNNFKTKSTTMKPVIQSSINEREKLFSTLVSKYISGNNRMTFLQNHIKQNTIKPFNLNKNIKNTTKLNEKFANKNGFMNNDVGKKSYAKLSGKSVTPLVDTVMSVRKMNTLTFSNNNTSPISQVLPNIEISIPQENKKVSNTRKLQQEEFSLYKQYQQQSIANNRKSKEIPVGVKASEKHLLEHYKNKWRSKSNMLNEQKRKEDYSVLIQQNDRLRDSARKIRMSKILNNATEPFGKHRIDTADKVKSMFDNFHNKLKETNERIYDYRRQTAPQRKRNPFHLSDKKNDLKINIAIPYQPKIIDLQQSGKELKNKPTDVPTKNNDNNENKNNVALSNQTQKMADLQQSVNATKVNTPLIVNQIHQSIKHSMSFKDNIINILKFISNSKRYLIRFLF